MMNDYISREAAIEKIKEESILNKGYSYSERGYHIIDILNDIPSADVQPVKRGKWKRVALILNRSVCSNCSWRTDEIDTFDFNFCPNCGAKMDEE